MKKIGRNDPCSCGSGKKFKKCCEEKKSSITNPTIITTPNKTSSFFQNYLQPKPPIQKTETDE